jgi:predicted nuclease of predicted toxin-antitoxin system
MRLLLDESVPRRLRRSLPDHDVRTVGETGWSGEKDGSLLAVAASRFEAFITVDRNLPYQQNLASLPLAVILRETRSIDLSELIVPVPALERAPIALVSRSFVRIVAS